MKKALIWLIGIIAVILVVVLLGGSYFFSNLLINAPTQELAEGAASMEEILADMDIPYEFALPAPEAVSIETGAVTLAGNYYENEAGGDCAVLLLHGYTGTRYGVLQYAPLFWERGCDLLAYDARGHGASTDAYHTYGYYEKDDGVAAYEWLLARSGLPPAQVGLAGVSYGAATVLQMLPLTPNVAFALADSPYQDLRTIVAHQALEQFGSWTAPFVPVAFLISEIRADFDADEVSPLEAVAGATAPILLVHSATDAFTPPSNSQAIYANSSQVLTELQINEWGSEHAADIITDYAAYDALVDGFLAEYDPDFGSGDGQGAEEGVTP